MATLAAHPHANPAAYSDVIATYPSVIPAQAGIQRGWSPSFDELRMRSFDKLGMKFIERPVISHALMVSLSNHEGAALDSRLRGNDAARVESAEGVEL